MLSACSDTPVPGGPPVRAGAGTRCAAMSTRFRLTVRGPLPRCVVEDIGARFTGATVRQAGPVTCVELGHADQPALRALLTLLWDVGQDVLSLTAEEPP